MRIGYVDIIVEPDKPGTTGLSDLVWDMAGRLADGPDEVHVVAPYSVTEMPHPRVLVTRFKLPPIAYQNIAGHILIVLSALRTLRSLGRFDVIHVPEYLSAGILSALMPDTPVVLTEPGNIYERVARGNPYDASTTIAYKAAARVAARRCAGLVATSDEMARWWGWTGFSPDRITRIPLGIDASLFERIEGARGIVGMDTEAPIVLYAARLSRENGVDIALQAFARVVEQLPAARLHILGDGPERQTLEGLAARLGLSERVTWHGWADMRLLPAYYSATDLFTFSGRSGGTPRVLIQAMACGAPVVASAIGGIVDHVEDGRTGLLFSSGDSEAMAERLLTILADSELRTRLAKAGQAYSREQLDWNVLVRRVRSEVYERVARR
ncbi:MAG: glycosyltransferase family 4 protein [Chloroflexi bacterium]|nr:glycosyltransferase family 4 protein [Chloroflexota bacterium]